MYHHRETARMPDPRRMTPKRVMHRDHAPNRAGRNSAIIVKHTQQFAKTLYAMREIHLGEQIHGHRIGRGNGVRVIRCRHPFGVHSWSLRGAGTGTQAHNGRDDCLHKNLALRPGRFAIVRHLSA